MMPETLNSHPRAADKTVEGYDDAKHFDLFTVSVPHW